MKGQETWPIESQVKKSQSTRRVLGIAQGKLPEQPQQNPKSKGHAEKVEIPPFDIWTVTRPRGKRISADARVGMKRSDNEKTKATNEKRKREVQAEKIMLSNTDIKDVIMKSNPTQAICFHFVRNTPWTEDMKIKAEESLKKLSEPVTRLLCLCSTNQEKKM